MGDTDSDFNTMSTPTSIQGNSGTRSGNGVVVVKQNEDSEYYYHLQIVLGTVCGVFGLLGLLLILSLLYRQYKKRRSQNYSTGGQNDQSSVSIDLDEKHVPSVLLLYAYDCAAHEKVVASLAGYLIETCNCNVHIDLFEDQIIFERGLDDWLVDRLQEVDYIIVMCSVGARLRCTKKRVRFKNDPCRKIPDYFAVAVDYVAEKMRVERSKGLPLSKYIVTYMDYSTASDIPHQLEMGTKFCLMRDTLPLFYHLHGVSSEPTKNDVAWPGICDKTFDISELGAELKISIESAKEFFKCNPNWVEDSMEFVPAMTGKSKSRHIRKSSLEPLLGDIKVTMPQTDDQRNLDTTANIYSQTLPRSVKQDHLNMVGSLQNRQNSLPSSLSSHQTLSTPPPQTNTSKSYDSFQSPTRYGEFEVMTCLVCGQEGEHHPKAKCKTHYQHQTTQESEDEFTIKMKSKSMPTVYGLNSSQTVFQAEVHKEWADIEGKFSPTDSQDSGSNKDLALEDLEIDLQSIIMPSTFKAGSLHYGAKTMMVDQPFPSHIHLTQTLGGTPHHCHPTAVDAALILQPLKKTFTKEDSSSSVGSIEEQIFQLQDIRL